MYRLLGYVYGDLQKKLLVLGCCVVCNTVEVFSVKIQDGLTVIQQGFQISQGKLGHLL